MQYPAGLPLIQVAGGITGTPAAAVSVEFRCDQWLENVTDNVSIGPFTVPAVIDTNGDFTVGLIPTDHPKLDRRDWAYEVILRWGNQIAKGSLTVPADTVGTLKLAEHLVLDQPADAGVIEYLRAADLGVRVPTLVNGKVPAAQLPAGSGGQGGPVDWADIENRPATFPPAGHTHTIADTTGLQTALDGKQTAGSYASTGSVTALAGRVTAVEQAEAGFASTGSVTALAGTVTTLAGRVTAVEQAEAGFASAGSVTALTGRVTAVEQAGAGYASTGSVTALAGTVTTLDNRVAAVEQAEAGHASAGDLATLTGRVTAVEQAEAGFASTGSVTALTGRVTAVEQAGTGYASTGSVTALTGRVSDVEAMTPVVLVWSGTEYVEAPAARVYVGGPGPTGSPADGTLYVAATA